MKEKFTIYLFANRLGYIILSFFVLLLVSNQTFAQTTVFIDSFNETNTTLNTVSASPSLTYTSNLSLGTTTPYASVQSNMLQIAGSTTQGLGYVSAPNSGFLSPYNATLSSNTDSVYWSFNMRTDRTTVPLISGFNVATNFGVATILACDNADPTNSSAKGYGVFFLKSATGTNNNFYLIYFTTGISNVTDSGKVTQKIIDSAGATISNSKNFYSLRVAFDPATSNWQFSFRNDGTTAFADPSSTATAYTVRTAVANPAGASAGLSTALGNFAFAFKWGTILQSGFFDMFKVYTIPHGPTLTATSLSNFGSIAVGANSTAQTFNLTGVNLTGAPGSLTVTAPSTDFQVSNNGSTWGSSTTISYSSSSLSSTLVYVRFTPQSLGVKSGNVTVAGGGATTINVPVAGTGVGPTISITPITLSFGTVGVSTNSASQTVSLSGTFLTGFPGFISITAPSTDFQVSTDNTTWGGSASVAYSSATLGATTIYIRFTPQSIGALSGNVAFSGGGASTTNVAVSGTGSGPVLTATPTTLSFINTVSGGASASSTFSLTGSFLTGYPGNISVTAPSTDFQVSNDNSTWGSSTTIAYSSATLGATTVYVRFTPQSVGALSGNVTVAGGGATTINVAVSGTGVNPSIVITGSTIFNTNSIVTFTAGMAVSVPYTAAGTINSGNIYTAQLSDASGSFASPVNIGTLNSTSLTGTISATLPATATYGTGYLIRVVSSNSVITGTANTDPLNIIPLQSLPYSQDFSSLTGATTTYPAGWWGWKMTSSNVGATATTAAPIAEKAFAGGDASTSATGAYDYNGKIGFTDASVENGITLAINTTGYSNVGLSFDAMTIRNPATPVVVGLQLQYRVGGTGTFTAVGSYSLSEYTTAAAGTQIGAGVTTGINVVNNLNVTLPSACNNQTIVEIRWVYHKISGGTPGTGTMPAVAIDNVFVGLSTQTIAPSTFIPGDAVTVPFTAAGVFNSGNVYTAQLSDASGSFASPTNIGTLTSNASGSGTISATIPGGATPGTGYRIRVVSSNPAINGCDNGANLTILAVQTLPYGQDFASFLGSTTVYPAGWFGSVISTSPPSSTGRTALPISDKAISGGTAANTTSGVYDYVGKIGFLSNSAADVALTLSVNTTGYSGGIGVSFDAMTIRNPYGVSLPADSIIQGLVLQYRVGGSGSFTNIAYSAAEYANNTTTQVTGTTGQNVIPGLNVTLPSACDNQSLVQLRWIYRTINGSAGSTGSRPALAIDNVYVGISTRSLSSNAYNPGDALTVTFNTAGVYTGGNVYTAQLSDASGSFSAPTNIGTLTSSSSGVQNISATIPGGTTAGGGYRIRVVSSTPFIIGTENGSDISITNAYYYGGTGNLHDVNNWWTSPLGTGTHPANFTTAYQLFKLINTTSVSTTGAWTISGTGTRLMVGDSSKPGVSLTIASGFPITISSPSVGVDIPKANSGVNIVYLQDATTPTFGTMYSNSEVHYQTTLSTGTTKSFGKLFIENNSTVTFSGTPTIQTSLTVASGSTMNTTNGSTFCKMNVLSGATVTINGTVNVQNAAGISCVSCDNTTGAVFNFAASSSGLSLGNASTIQYAKVSAGVQSIQPYPYANLEISGNAGNPKTIQTTGGIGTAASVSNILTVNTATLNTTDSLTLLSTASGTACVAPVTGVINGSVTVQRYIPANANRAWRLLSVPTNTTQTINSSWQNGQATGVAGPNNKGTWISSKLSTALANHYDSWTNNSLLTYNNSTSAWDGVTTATDTTHIATDHGYMLFVRGDRTANNLYSTITPTTLSTFGTLKTGNYPATPMAINANKYECVGNPYASAINLNNINLGGNTDRVFYIWDPLLIGSSAVGAYQTLTYNGSAYIITPGGGSYGANGSVMDTIQSGQAFLAHATGGSGTIQFTESAKLTGSRNVFRTMNTSPQQLAVNLYIKNGQDLILADGSLCMVDNSYSNDVDASDAAKLTNSGESVSMVRAGKKLATELRQFLIAGDSIALYTGKLKAPLYQFEFNATNLQQSNLQALLYDKYLRNTLPVNLNGNTHYEFSVNSDSCSFATDRFQINFIPLVQAGPLPLTFTSINAMKDHGHVNLFWNVTNQINIDHYTIERSTDGVQFSSIGNQPAQGGNNSDRNYSMQDFSVQSMVYYYRVKSVDIDGHCQYSHMVRVNAGQLMPVIQIVPNPVVDRQIHLGLTDLPAGNYQIQLYNSQGQLMQESVFTHAPFDEVQLIHIGQAISPGNYELKIIHPDQHTTIKSMLIAESN